MKHRHLHHGRMTLTAAKAIGLLFISLLWEPCQPQHLEPCLVPGISQEAVSELVNPRTSSTDQALLVNLPFAKLFCSPSVARFLLIGNWSQRHLLQLDSAVTFSAAGSSSSSSGTPASSDRAWQTVDVTEASSTAAYDYLVLPTDGAVTMRPSATYFAALTACNPQLCRSVGLAQFQTPPATSPSPEAAGDSGESLTRTVAIAVGCGLASVTAFVVVVVVVACLLVPGGSGGGGGGGERRPVDGMLADDSLDAIGSMENHTYMKPDISARGPDLNSASVDGAGDNQFDRTPEAPPKAVAMSTFTAGVANPTYASMHPASVEAPPPSTNSMPAASFQNDSFPSALGNDYDEVSWNKNSMEAINEDTRVE